VKIEIRGCVYRLFSSWQVSYTTRSGSWISSVVRVMGRVEVISKQFGGIDDRKRVRSDVNIAELKL